eukprot:SAG11_NODE_1339_length_5169_cov_2.613412_6_plen_28_part_01
MLCEHLLPWIEMLCEESARRPELCCERL